MKLKGLKGLCAGLALAMLTSLAGLIEVLTLVITQISSLFTTIKQLFGF